MLTISESHCYLNTNIMLTASIGIVLLAISAFNCMQMIPERANVTYVNEKYLTYGRIYISRHGRKSPYYINVEGGTKQTWANNVTVHLIFFEYLHNEYRRSFVEIHLKFCEMMTTDPYIGGMLLQHGVECPAPPKEYHLLNMTVPTEKFPNLFPIAKAKIEVEITTTDKAETIVKAYAMASFISKKKNTSS